MNSEEAFGEPSDVAAEGGDVIVEGPDGVAVTLTADAAAETGRRMLRAARDARRQAGSGSGVTAHADPGDAGEA